MEDLKIEESFPGFVNDEDLSSIEKKKNDILNLISFNFDSIDELTLGKSPSKNQSKSHISLPETNSEEHNQHVNTRAKRDQLSEAMECIGMNFHPGIEYIAPDDLQAILSYVPPNDCASTTSDDIEINTANNKIQEIYVYSHCGAFKPNIKPIHVSQVHPASDPPNFFIGGTPISKLKNQIMKFLNILMKITLMLTQSHIKKKFIKLLWSMAVYMNNYMLYEMKQTRRPSLIIYVIQEPKYLDEYSEINDLIREHLTPMVSMQSFSYMVSAMRHVFKHLNTHELLIASRVCVPWNIIAMDKVLWRTVRLKNSMVCNWNKSIAAIDGHGSVKLDTRRMLLPTKIEDYDKFWLDFTIALKKAQQLKCIELYRCPAKVVEETIDSLPQLAELNASSIKNPNLLKEETNSDKLIILNLKNLHKLTNLTELRIKGLTGIKLTDLSSFKNLVNLKLLSVTSIKAFPTNFYHILETVTANLKFLEIGDCDYLSNGFVRGIRRLTNLTSLRLENCHGTFDLYAQEVFSVIRSLGKLKILELINIEFCKIVEDELEKCRGVKALFIVPMYISHLTTTNCRQIGCLKKLSNTLTHFVWGLTKESCHSTDTFINEYSQDQLFIDCNFELSRAQEGINNISILRTKQPRQQLKFIDVANMDKGKDKSNTIEILSVPAFEKLLQTMMAKSKTKIVKIPYRLTTRVYPHEYFNDV